MRRSPLTDGPLRGGTPRPAGVCWRVASAVSTGRARIRDILTPAQVRCVGKYAVNNPKVGAMRHVEVILPCAACMQVIAEP
jgi:cytidine deaminase